MTMPRLLHAKRCHSYIASFHARIPRFNQRFYANDAKKLPTSAEIVVAGGGVTGSSVAYHLAKLGKTDVLVLEQGSLGCGTTWHSVGLLGRTRASSIAYNFGAYAYELFSNLEQDTGLSTGLKKCGTVMVARTKDREIASRRLHDAVSYYGHECELISPKDAQELCPLIRIDDLKMAIWSPNEGALNASDACASLMKGATQRGVQFFDGVGVRKVCTNGKRVVGVETDQGYVQCEKFINCGGQWGRELGLRTDPPVNLPLHSCEHFYIVTKPMEGVHSMMPVIRDYDAYIYIREWSGGLLAGGFEPMGKSCFYETGIPHKFEFQLLPEDWEQFEILMQGTINRVPSIENAEIRQFVNGPESFTPDGKFLFGEVPEVENYYAACGMNSAGVMSAPGMGKITAELVTEGHCSLDTSSIDIKRLTKEQNNKFFLQSRVKEILGQHYGIDYPGLKTMAARPLKTSPLYDVLSINGADWGEIGGWERANWFNKGSTEHTLTFGKPSWHGNVEEEYKACKEDAGIADMSWQSKFEITGDDALGLVNEMQRLFAADIDLAVGTSITSALLNQNGNYIAIADVHRLDNNKFLVVTSPSHHNHLLSWISKNSNKVLRIQDVTSKFACFGIFGPNSADFLQKLTLQPLNDFSVNQNEVVDLGNASNVILHHRCLGECDQWQAFVPVELCRGVYKNIFDAGSVKNVGHYAINALRIDAGVPEIGTDIGPLSSPVDFGTFSFVNQNKDAQFIGKEAVQHAATQSKKSLAMLAFDCDEDNWAWGGEPVFADETSIGRLSSVSFSFSRHKMVALSVLPKDKILKADKSFVRVAKQDKMIKVVAINKI